MPPPQGESHPFPAFVQSEGLLLGSLPLASLHLRPRGGPAVADSPVPAVWGSQGEKQGQGTGLELPCVPRLMQEAGRQGCLTQLRSRGSRSNLPTGAGLGRTGAVLCEEEGRGCPRPRFWLPQGFWGAWAAGRAPTGFGIVWAGGRRRQRWALGAWWAGGNHVGRGKHGGCADNVGLRPETPLCHQAGAWGQWQPGEGGDRGDLCGPAATTAMFAFWRGAVLRLISALCLLCDIPGANNALPGQNPERPERDSKGNSARNE